MHLPTREVLAEMQPEGGGLWFVPAEGTDTHAILAKAPSSVIKAVVRGAPVEFLIGISEIAGRRYLGTGLRVHDDHDSPVTYFRVQKNPIQHRAIVEILARRSTPLFFFDELCRSVAWAECLPDRDSSSQILDTIQDSDTLYSGAFDDCCNAVLDAMQAVIDPTSINSQIQPFDSVWLHLQLETLNFIDIQAIGTIEAHTYQVNQIDEGAGQEVNAWHLLESIFPEGVVRSPLVTEGSKERELTDILCYYAHDNLKGLFLVESKALSVLAVSPDQSMER